MEKWKQGTVTLAKLLNFSEPQCSLHGIALSFTRDKESTASQQARQLIRTSKNRAPLPPPHNSYKDPDTVSWKDLVGSIYNLLLIL